MKNFSLKSLRPSTVTEQRIRRWVEGAMFLFSLMVLGVLFVDYGYTLQPHEQRIIQTIFRLAKGVYFVFFLLRLLFDWRTIRRKSIALTFTMGVALLATLLPHWFPLATPDHALSGLWALFSNKYYVGGVVGLYAILELSRGVVGMINRRTNPALLLVSGFMILIILGTLLLLVPRSTLPEIHLSIVDALFVSTSAVCVTGLTPVDVSSTFTIEGQTVILLLIQIGGLGVMTITSFFALFFMGGTGLFNQFALRDMLSSDTFSSLLSMLLYILGFTFVIEIIGALLIWHNIHGTLGMGLHEELYFSLFHAISAFCNAGFSTLEGNLGNPLVMQGHNALYLWISLLVILGGIGFPILVNFKEILFYYGRMVIHRIFAIGKKPVRYYHLTNINTKIVLTMTTILLVGGTAAIAALEWHGAFAQMSLTEKLTHALFNATVPRTAGFNSVSVTQFSTLTLLLSLVLMWIGGASQSTAGGIKVNTLGVAWANFLSVVRGRESVTLFGREIPADSVRRTSATILGSLIVLGCSLPILILLEPDIHPMRLLFEAVSALGTVGSSMDTTPLLGEPAKLFISLLMFTGRVGLITVLLSLMPQRSAPRYRLPKEHVIIN